MRPKWYAILLIIAILAVSTVMISIADRDSAPGQDQDVPDQADRGEAPGQQGTTPGQEGLTPGQDEDAPAPGQEGGSAPGQEGTTPGLCDYTVCDGACVDTQSDPTNCNECGHVCDDGETCEDGQCVGISRPPRRY